VDVLAALSRGGPPQPAIGPTDLYPVVWIAYHCQSGGRRPGILDHSREMNNLARADDHSIRSDLHGQTLLCTLTLSMNSLQSYDRTAN
jgi:hypothetical protein